MYLFIHGTGATSSFWLPQIRSILSLDENFSDASILETFTLPLPGHPRLDKEFSLQDTREYIQDALQTKLPLQQKMASKLILSGKPEIVAGLRSDRLILVGHSVGGVIALDFAMAKPGLVEKLVLVSTPNKFNQIWVGFLDWFYTNWLFNRSEKFLHWTQNVVTSLRWKTALQIFIENPKRRGFNSLMKIVKDFDFEKEFQKLSLDEQLKLIKIPILAISGNRDLLVNSAEVEKIGLVLESQAGLARSKKTIIQIDTNSNKSKFVYKLYKGVGHNTMDEDLAAFVVDFRQFLK